MSLQGSSEAKANPAVPPAPPTTWAALFKPLLQSAVRHSLTTIGGGLVAHGWVSSGTSEQLIGVGMTAAGLAWSWWNARGRALVLNDIANLRAVLQQRADAARAARDKGPPQPPRGA